MSDEQIKTGLDIVDRLREPNDGVLSHKWGEMRRTMKEAADEIERLRELKASGGFLHYDDVPTLGEHGVNQSKADRLARLCDERGAVIEQQRDEIERLRSLITAWADARPRLSDGSRSKTFEDARSALRKAVGR